MKAKFFYISIIVITIILIAVISYTAPREIDWADSFNDSHKSPYGTFILSESLSDVFDEEEIIRADLSAYETLEDYEGQPGASYIIIDDWPGVDEESMKSLISWVKEGNNLFYASRSFYEDYFRDTLGIQTKLLDIEDLIAPQFDSVVRRINFVNPELESKDGYVFTKSNFGEYFSSFNEEKATVISVLEGEYPNMLRFSVGSGYIYISSVPHAFTNYALVKGSNAEYAFKALSYLPRGPVFWDTHYISKRNINMSAFRYLQSSEPLSWALYTAFYSLIIFMAFSFKRRQKPIPVIEPPKNAILEFVNVTANLYFRGGDHLSLAKKKAKYFYEFARSQLYIDTRQSRDKLIESLSMKTGIGKDEIESIIKQAESLEKADMLSDAALIKLNSSIDNFYKKVKK